MAMLTQGEPAHLPSGNARPAWTVGAFPILCLTTEVTTAPRDTREGLKNSGQKTSGLVLSR